MERIGMFPSQIIQLFNRETVQAWCKGQTYLFRKGDHMYYPGKIENEIYLIVDGNARLFHLHSNGKECILGIVTAGDFIDIASVFTDKPSDAYAIALTDVSAVKIAKSKIRDEVMRTPELSMALLNHFAGKLQDVIRILEQVAYEKVEERLYTLLEKLADHSVEQAGWHPLPSFLTHKDLAGMIASTRETVTFLINKFIQNGMIQYKQDQIWLRSIRDE